MEAQTSYFARVLAPGGQADENLLYFHGYMCVRIFVLI